MLGKFLVLLFLAFPVLEARLGAEKCTWGPSYWCQHLGTAKECGSQKFCLNVWKNADIQRDTNTAECTFCKLFVQDIDMLLKKNKTVEEIRMLVNKACSIVPETSLQALCKSFADNYLPEIISLVEAQLSPQRVCSALSLCSSSGRKDPLLEIKTPLVKVPLEKTQSIRHTSLPNLSKVFGASSENAVLCDECVLVITDVKKALENNQTEAEIADFLKKDVCTKLGPLKDSCNQLVDQYLPEIISLLDSEIQPKQICTMLGFCTSLSGIKAFKNHAVVQLMQVQKRGGLPGFREGIECEVCELLIKEARVLITKNSTEQEVIEFIKNRVCTLVPAEKEKCQSAVTEYGPIIFQLIASSLDPQTVCQALGACGKSAKLHFPKAGPQCILCEYVIRELEMLIITNKSEAAVENALKAVCSIMPATIRQDCTNFVNQYAPVIIKLIVSGLSPKMVCTTIGLCAPGTKQPAVPFTNLARIPSAESCTICQTVVLYVKGLMNENSTQMEITKIVEKVCNFLPKNDQPACRAFVDEYGPYLIQILLQDLNPKQICTSLRLCASDAEERSAKNAEPQTLRPSRRLGNTLRYQASHHVRPNGMVHMEITNP